MATQTIETPDLGNDQTAEVIEICVMAGDSVTEGDPLIVLKSDKASMEIPSPLSGVIQGTKSQNWRQYPKRQYYCRHKGS